MIFEKETFHVGYKAKIINNKPFTFARTFEKIRQKIKNNDTEVIVYCKCLSYNVKQNTRIANGSLFKW